MPILQYLVSAPHNRGSYSEGVRPGPLKKRGAEPGFRCFKMTRRSGWGPPGATGRVYPPRCQCGREEPPPRERMPIPAAHVISNSGLSRPPAPGAAGTRFAGCRGTSQNLCSFGSGLMVTGIAERPTRDGIATDEIVRVGHRECGKRKEMSRGRLAA